MNYSNPIIRGMYPDPSIVRVEEDYYVINSSFEYLPAVPLFHSKDLINWKQISYVVDRDSQIDLKDCFDSGGIYAPTIRYHNGIFYMITTNLYKGNFIVTTSNPLEGWSDPIFIENTPGIDPSLYFEDDKVFMQYSCLAHGMFQCELDPVTFQIKGRHEVLSYGCGGRDPEGPHLYKKGKYYYLLSAEGGTREGHMIVIQRSTSLWGPFEACPHNPIVTNRNAKGEILQAVGHGDFVEDIHGDWWIVALAHREKKHKHILGRETILLPVEWINDWPVIKDGIASSVIETSRECKEQERINYFYDDFSGTSLDLQWSTLRSFHKEHVERKNNTLVLKGNEYTLSDDSKDPVFLCIRQKEWKGSWRVKIESIVGEGECGVSLYADHNHHLDLIVKKNESHYSVHLRKCVGDIVHNDKASTFTTTTLGVKVECDGIYYTYSCFDGVKDVEIGKSLCKHLATEVADTMFTGTMFGMFAYGKDTSASFSTFRYDYGVE